MMGEEEIDFFDVFVTLHFLYFNGISMHPASLQFAIMLLICKKRKRTSCNVLLRYVLLYLIK